MNIHDLRHQLRPLTAKLLALDGELIGSTPSPAGVAGIRALLTVAEGALDLALEAVREQARRETT